MLLMVEEEGGRVKEEEPMNRLLAVLLKYIGTEVQACTRESMSEVSTMSST